MSHSPYVFKFSRSPRLQMFSDVFKVNHDLSLDTVSTNQFSSSPYKKSTDIQDTDTLSFTNVKSVEIISLWLWGLWFSTFWKKTFVSFVKAARLARLLPLWVVLWQPSFGQGRSWSSDDSRHRAQKCDLNEFRISVFCGLKIVESERFTIYIVTYVVHQLLLFLEKSLTYVVLRVWT